ncbi:Diacylglycerol kinase [bioreactor metagenome]|uniref:Diacylglycerol kinase n=1 Tax=bioreactor metagenome TaxID=1076179 RepID=A0A645CH35_9ZZZZ
MFTTAAPKDATQIVVNQAANYDLIVCCGGDGTLNEVLSGLISAGHENIPVGYIPCGTTNDFARTLHLSKDIPAATRHILKGRSEIHDVGYIKERGSGPAKIFFNYIASFGAFTEVSYATPQKLKNKFGYLAYTINGVKSVGKIKPIHAKVDCCELKIEDNFIFGGISNSLSVGGIIKMMPDEVSLNDGKFEVLLVKNPQSISDWKSILNAIDSQTFDGNGVFFFKTSHIELEFDYPVPFTNDGEFAGEYKHAVLGICDKKITFIT